LLEVRFRSSPPLPASPLHIDPVRLASESRIAVDTHARNEERVAAWKALSQVFGRARRKLPVFDPVYDLAELPDGAFHSNRVESNQDERVPPPDLVRELVFLTTFKRGCYPLWKVGGNNGSLVKCFLTQALPDMRVDVELLLVRL